MTSQLASDSDPIHTFVIFDVVFHLAAGTVDLLIEYLGAGVFHIRDDKAGVNALLADLDLDDYPARA